MPHDEAWFMITEQQPGNIDLDQLSEKDGVRVKQFGCQCARETRRRFTPTFPITP
jgi:hypothetical protein